MIVGLKRNDINDKKMCIFVSIIKMKLGEACAQISPGV